MALKFLWVNSLCSLWCALAYPRTPPVLLGNDDYFDEKTPLMIFCFPFAALLLKEGIPFCGFCWYLKLFYEFLGKTNWIFDLLLYCLPHFLCSLCAFSHMTQDSGQSLNFIMIHGICTFIFLFSIRNRGFSTTIQVVHSWSPEMVELS